MSLQQLQAFVDESKKNEGVQAKLKSVSSHAELVELGKQSGFIFSLEDVDKAEQLGRQKMENISEDELQAVSGGGVYGSPASDAIGSAENWFQNKYDNVMTGVYKAMAGKNPFS